MKTILVFIISLAVVAIISFVIRQALLTNQDLIKSTARSMETSGEMNQKKI